MDVETLASGYGLIEGPRADSQGNLYFSDVPNGGVYRRSPDGRIETVVPRRRGVGGIALHADGGIVISGRDICHVKAGESRTLFRSEDIPGFNDIFTDDQGRVFAGSIRSDPFRDGERTAGELWRVEEEGRASELYADVGLSNGIGLSPDRRHLYHSDSSARAILVHDLDPEGNVSNRRELAKLSTGVPDGLAVDEAGGIWVAVYGGGCVARYDPEGKLDRTLDLPARSITSLCFGGDDLRDLYVVSADNGDDPARAGSIFRVRADVAGLPAPLARI